MPFRASLECDCSEIVCCGISASLGVSFLERMTGKNPPTMTAANPRRIGKTMDSRGALVRLPEIERVEISLETLFRKRTLVAAIK